MGWYWRVKAPQINNIDGAPSQFVINSNYQLARGTFIALAIAYPAATTFQVVMSYNGQAMPAIAMASSLRTVLAPDENPVRPEQMTCTGTSYYNCQYTGTNTGFSWYFDRSYLYLRIVPFGIYNQATRYSARDNYFGAYGAKVNNIISGIIAIKFISENSGYIVLTFYSICFQDLR